MGMIAQNIEYTKLHHVYSTILQVEEVNKNGECFDDNINNSGCNYSRHI